MAEYNQAWIGLGLPKTTKGYVTKNLDNWKFHGCPDVLFVKSLSAIVKKGSP